MVASDGIPAATSAWASARIQGRGWFENRPAQLDERLIALQENRRDWFYDVFPRHFDSLAGRFSNFVCCDAQHRTAFDLGDLDEVLPKTGFQDVTKSVEGESWLDREMAPGFEPGDVRGLPHSPYVESFK